MFSKSFSFVWKQKLFNLVYQFYHHHRRRRRRRRRRHDYKLYKNGYLIKVVLSTQVNTVDRGFIIFSMCYFIIPKEMWIVLIQKKGSNLGLWWNSASTHTDNAICAYTHLISGRHCACKVKMPWDSQNYCLLI